MDNPKRPDEVLDEIYFEDGLQRVLKECLTEREYSVISLRFWDELTYREIGKAHNICAGRASQVEKKALRKLRNPSNREEFMKLGGLIDYFASFWKKEEKPLLSVPDQEITLVKRESVPSVDPDGPLPDFVVVERWDHESEPYLAIREGDLGLFPPLTMKQYQRWLAMALEREQDALRS